MVYNYIITFILTLDGIPPLCLSKIEYNFHQFASLNYLVIGQSHQARDYLNDAP